MPDVDWHPGRFRGPLDDELRRRAGLCGAVGVARVRLLSGRPGTPRLRSLPGESPRRQTGRLVATFGHVVRSTARAIYAAIRSPLDYALYLERDLDRPHLTRMLAEMRETFRSILTRGG